MLKQIKAVVKDFAQDQRHKDTDSAILSILSHGENGKVIGKFIFFSVYTRRPSLDDATSLALNRNVADQSSPLH